MPSEKVDNEFSFYLVFQFSYVVIVFQFPGGAPGGLPGMPSLPGIPASMQQRLELPSVSLAQSLSLSRQQEHLMALANSSAASVAASAAGGLGGPPPGPNPEKLGLTNVSFNIFIFYIHNFNIVLYKSLNGRFQSLIT